MATAFGDTGARNWVTVSDKYLAKIQRSSGGGWDLDPPLHTGGYGTIKAVDFSWRIGSEESKELSIGRKGHGNNFFEFSWCDHHRNKTFY